MLSDAIYKRCAIRKFKDEVLNDEIMDNISGLIHLQQPLFSDIQYQIDIVKNGKDFQKIIGGIIGSYGKVRAPHYIIASTEESRFSHENIGYLLEYIVLKLTEMNIGTCWIGGGIKADLFRDFLHTAENLKPIVVIAFGYPEDLAMFRNKFSKVKRIPPEEYYSGIISDEYKHVMELVRLAPSAVNLQPARYVYNGNKVDICRVKNNIIMKNYMDDMNRIDLGISLCHFEIGINETGKHLILTDENKGYNKLIYFKTCIL